VGGEAEGHIETPCSMSPSLRAARRKLGNGAQERKKTEKEREATLVPSILSAPSEVGFCECDKDCIDALRLLPCATACTGSHS
jgi:hypothetical protein